MSNLENSDFHPPANSAAPMMLFGRGPKPGKSAVTINCPDCGVMLVRFGTCFSCPLCGLGSCE